MGLYRFSFLYDYLYSIHLVTCQIIVIRQCLNNIIKYQTWSLVFTTSKGLVNDIANTAEVPDIKKSFKKTFR